jgi:hypothetical protein
MLLHLQMSRGCKFHTCTTCCFPCRYHRCLGSPTSIFVLHAASPADVQGLRLPSLYYMLLHLQMSRVCKFHTCTTCCFPRRCLGSPTTIFVRHAASLQMYEVCKFHDCTTRCFTCRCLGSARFMILLHAASCRCLESVPRLLLLPPYPRPRCVESPLMDSNLGHATMGPACGPVLPNPLMDSNL